MIGLTAHALNLVRVGKFCFSKAPLSWLFISGVYHNSPAHAPINPPPDTVKVTRDTTIIKGTASASGLVQTGDENRLVTSLLSDLTIGNRRFEVAPLTSVAYSSKPHAQVEGEYLENVIVRYHQTQTFYPAAGIDFEKSFLRKIRYRYSGGFTLVCNLLSRESQRIKLGVGYNHEVTQYEINAFYPSIDNRLHYSRSLDQIYVRLKGENSLFNHAVVFSYDFFYQPTLQNFSDYRWTLIANLDLPLNRRFSFRSSAVSSYEKFVATNVARYNFRLTFGASWSM